MKMAPHPALAARQGRYVGDPVAVVIAETLAQARTRPRRSRSTTRCCRRSPIRPRRRKRARRRSTTSRRTTRSTSGISATKARRGRVRSRPSTSPSSTSSTTGWCPNPMEPRAAIGRIRCRHATPARSGIPRRTRMSRGSVIAAFVGMAPEHKLRVIAPDVGGGFGSKIFIYPEEIVCAVGGAASRPSGQMDFAIASEAFLADAHGRDHVTHAEMAFDADGKIIGLARQDDRQSRRLHVDLLVVGADLSLRARCCRASTPSRRSIARSTRSTPTPCRSTPIAAPGGRKRPSWSSGWSRSARANWAWIRRNCGGRTSSRRSRIRRR